MNKTTINRRTKTTRHRAPHGIATPMIVIGLVVVALLGFAGFYFTNQPGSTELFDPIMTHVTRGEFVSEVLDQGEIQSSENVEIRCEVRARNGSLSVIRITPEGTLVESGDFLVELDSTSFEKELEQQNIAMANAETSVIQAETSHASAIATKKEYLEGIYIEKYKQIENEIYDAESAIETARQSLSQAEDVLGHSKKLLVKGFETKQAVESNRFDVRKYEIALKKGKNSEALAKKKLEVLELITLAKETVQLEADIKAAKVRLASEIKAQAVETEKLAEIEEMIAKCIIVVPEDVSGQVVYAQESSRGGNDWVLEEGTTVRQNQVLVRLPNPDKMEVKALINEQSITQIAAGMPVTIKVDALNKASLKGVVTKVSQYAENNNWRSGNIKKFPVFVTIIDPPDSLKPGMNASVSIQVQYEPNALLAPIQTIYGVQEQQFCLGRTADGKWKTLEVKLGGDNSQMVYFTDGVEEGVELVMDPGAYKELMDLPEFKHETRIEIPEGSMPEIGKTSNETDGSANARPGGGGRGPGGGGRGGFSIPESGAALIASKDTDGDGKLSTEEAGPMFGRMIESGDTDGDGLLSESEADEGIKKIKAMMKNRGGGDAQRGGEGQRGRDGQRGDGGQRGGRRQ